MLTVSDGVHHGTREDRSGEVLAALAAAAGHDVVWRDVLPDERDEIASCLARLCDEDVADVVLSTGGTGFAPRDVTPEAAGAILERLSPGIDEALRADALRHTPHGMLSRSRLRHPCPHRRDHAAGQPEGLRGRLGGARTRARPRRQAPALRADGPRPMSAIPLAQRFANLVRFEHTVFALPYAYVGAILAVDGWPGISALGWITVAMFGARSFAMAVNRLVDAAIDARNPRTAGRELPAGRLRRNQVIAFALASLLVFAVGVSQLAPITRWLAPLVIVPMVIYPYLKRYTPLCHLWLGAVDGLAPVGGWVAVTGHFDPAAWLLGRGRGVLDRGLRHHLRHDGHRGRPRAGAALDPRRLRRRACASRVACAARAQRRRARRGGADARARACYAVGVAAVAILLAYEQHLVSPTDLSRVNMAFLNVNGVIALLYLGAVALDVALS